MSDLEIKTRTNREVTLQEGTLRNFKESLRGELIFANDAGYDDARSIWNAMIDRRPALIARCLGVADVVTCVNFARKRSLRKQLRAAGCGEIEMGSGKPVLHEQEHRAIVRKPMIVIACRDCASHLRRR